METLCQVFWMVGWIWRIDVRVMVRLSPTENLSAQIHILDFLFLIDDFWVVMIQRLILLGSSSWICNSLKNNVCKYFLIMAVFQGQRLFRGHLLSAIDTIKKGFHFDDNLRSIYQPINWMKGIKNLSCIHWDGKYSRDFSSFIWKCDLWSRWCLKKHYNASIPKSF